MLFMPIDLRDQYFGIHDRHGILQASWRVVRCIHMDMLATGTIDKRPMMAQAPDNFLQLSHFGILQFRAHHLG